MEENNIVTEEPKKGLTTWLFNPFYYIAGGRALLIGIAIIILAGIIGAASNTHFDGIIDVHSGKKLPLWFDIAAGPVNWIIMAILLFISGLIISKSKFRIVDVFGTQALARFPTIIMAIITFLPGYREITGRMVSEKDALSMLLSSTSDFIIFLVVLITTLLLTVWMVYLIYRAFSVSYNVKGGKAIGIFIAAIVIGEMVSKAVFISLIRGFLKI